MVRKNRWVRFWLMMMLCLSLGLVGCTKDDGEDPVGKTDGASAEYTETSKDAEGDEVKPEMSEVAEESTEDTNGNGISGETKPVETEKNPESTEEEEGMGPETTGAAQETEQETLEETEEEASSNVETEPVETEPEQQPSNFVSMNQAEIVAAMGAGWNLGNQLEAAKNKLPGETNWGNPVITPELLALVKQAGFQSVRVPVAYLNKIGPGPDYEIDAAWLERIKQVVDYCIENDLYVVINMHGDGYYSVDGSWLLCGEANQDEICEKYKAVWGQIATYFQDYDHHLLFESMNEEFDGTYGTPNRTYYENINRYNQIFVDTVRTSGGNNDERWIIVPGWNTDIDYTVGNYGFQIPTDTYRSSAIPAGEQRIMISVHYYTPWDFCGTENGNVTQWGDVATDSSKVAGYGKEADMKKQIQKVKDAFVSKGYPVFIGEYGAIDKTSYDASNNYYRAYFLQRMCELSKENGCVPMYWDNGYNGVHGFGLFNRKTKQVTQQELIDAIMTVYRPELLTGNATSVTLDQTSLTLKLGETATLQATMAPVGAQDVVSFTSADTGVVTVSPMGKVTAIGVGTTTITATTRSGKTATCQVTVEASQSVSVKLYLMETVSWATLESNETIEIPLEGGIFTCTMDIPQAAIESIGSLYFKDVLVFSGQANKSLYQGATIRLDSVKVNGTECGILSGEEQVITSGGVFDYCLINRWAVSGAKLEGFQVDRATENYFYPGASETNKLEVTFTITGVEK